LWVIGGSTDFGKIPSLLLLDERKGAEQPHSGYQLINGENSITLSARRKYSAESGGASAITFVKF